MKYIEMMFWDMCDIARNVYSENSVTGESEYSRQVMYEGVKCRLSRRYGKRGSGAVYKNGKWGKLSGDEKLFTAIGIDILAGDIITVQRQGKALVYTAGEAVMYETHQEVVLHKEEYV